MSRSEAYNARNKAVREASANRAQAKAAAAPTAQIIPAQASELGVRWEVEDVPDGRGGKLHWVGDRSAKKVLLYFHGDYFPTTPPFCIDPLFSFGFLMIIRWWLQSPLARWECGLFCPKSKEAGS